MRVEGEGVDLHFSGDTILDKRKGKSGVVE